MKAKKPGGCLLLIAIAVALSWGVYECKFYYSKWSDYHYSPWAYSDDKNEKLLPGSWEGSFSDPDKVAKHFKLEIFVPVTNEERAKKAARRWKKSSYSSRNKNRFDGLATVTSLLGTEQYEINGHVATEDFHKLVFGFHLVDEKKQVLPNFTLFEAKNGNWNGDQLSVTLSFNYHLADGSGHWESGDPRFQQTVNVKLKRVVPGK